MSWARTLRFFRVILTTSVRVRLGEVLNSY